MTGKKLLLISLLLSIMLFLVEYLGWADYDKFWPRVILGIIGLFFMLIMHFYSLRKRKKDWKIFERLPYKLPQFLDFHILMATIGVVVIIFHAFGDYNSIIAWVAFSAMSIVWLSGFIGRYIYVKIPKNLKGMQETRGELLEEMEQANLELLRQVARNHEDQGFQDALNFYLKGFEKYLHHLHSSNDSSFIRFFHNVWQMFVAWRYYTLQSRQFTSEQSFLQALRENAGSASVIEGVSEEHLREYSMSIRNLLLLQFQLEFLDVMKGLFKNWHDFHIPLTYLFYTTTVLHIIVITFFGAYAQ